MTNEASGTDNEEGRSCPKCGEQLTKVGKFWVCPTHGQVPEPKPFTALRIFLSYGHDANEPLVRRIKTDLEQRGHDVWFDKNDIRPGDNWRRSITEGILHCDRFLSFLSKHSTRDPGVCRDEIAISIGVMDGNIQTILVESEAEVRPPVSISHVQWLDMHDWKTGHGTVQAAKDQPATGDGTWEPWYQGKLGEIRRIVESEQSRQFAGEIEKLNEYLKPIKSHARIKQLLEKGFVGRAWLFDAVEKWRTASEEGSPDKGGACGSRLFWITGDPGVGKSAFAAQLTHTRSDAVIAAQFVEWDKPDHRDARRVVRSLAFQLATRLPDYRKLLLTLPEIAELDRKDPAELFDYLLANPLRSVIGGGRERQLIVIDALDEAGEAGRNPLVEMLARHAPCLPDWLGLVVTSRPESAVETPLQGLNPFVLDTRTEANRADLRDYLRQKLAPQLHARPDAGRLLGQILDKSEGVFLYVERFCDDVQQNHLSLDRPEQFPQGLGGIFCQWFQRQFPDLEKFRQDVRPALRAILAAREPLPVEILQRLFHWLDEELRDFTRTLGSLFPVTKEANVEVIKPYHKSLADWLGNEAKAAIYFVSIAAGQRMLADMCWLEYQQGVHKMSLYALKYLPDYLADSEEWRQLVTLLLDVSFIRRKRHVIAYESLHRDFARAFASPPFASMKPVPIGHEISRFEELSVACSATVSEVSARTESERQRWLFARVAGTIEELVSFQGREDVTTVVEKELEEHRGVLVLGQPGAGKSLFLKHLWIGNLNRTICVHMCHFRIQQSLDPRAFLAAMSIGLCKCVPEYADRLQRYCDTSWLHKVGADEMFDCLIRKPLQGVKDPAQPALVLIDALDEAVPMRGSLVEHLCEWVERLPAWIRAVGTSRYNPEISRCFRTWSFVDLGNATDVEIVRYIRSRFRTTGLCRLVGDRAAEITSQIVAQSEGSFLYAKLMLDALEEGRMNPTGMSACPPNLGYWFWNVFREMFPDHTEYARQYLPILSALATTTGSITCEKIAEQIGVTPRDARGRLDYLAGILRQEGDGVAFFHSSLKEWLFDPRLSGEFFVGRTGQRPPPEANDSER